jgi:hypothetical protein
MGDFGIRIRSHLAVFVAIEVFFVDLRRKERVERLKQPRPVHVLSVRFLIGNKGQALLKPKPHAPHVWLLRRAWRRFRACHCREDQSGQHLQTRPGGGKGAHRPRSPTRPAGYSQDASKYG